MGSIGKGNKQITIFEGRKIRRHWDEKQEKWFFSVVDIIQILTNQANFQLARNYWKVLKNRLNKEGSETVTKCNRLKMKAEDGKFRETDVADVETLLRLIQSVPSPKAEPVKLWLARVGYERMQETFDPEKSINRARKNWQRLGRSGKWIQQRMMGQEIRNKLTDYWKNNEVKEQNEYAILTNIIHQEWSDLSVKEHKDLKNLKTENLRDHMTDAELVFTALAELSTKTMPKEAKARIKINELIDSVNWVFAKTMLEIPHEYIVIDDYPEKSKEIVEFTELIRINGYEKEFYGKKYRYLNFNSYKYWVVENIINRARLQE